MFGVSTNCLINKPLNSALSILADLTSVVEVMDDGPHFLDSSEILKSFSFKYFLHAPSRGVNISSHLEPIRKASVEVIRHCVSIGSEVDAQGIIVHPGYFGWADERDICAFQLQKSLIEIIEFSKEYSTKVFIENMPKWDFFFLKTPEELSLISGFPLALDVGHANTNNCLNEFLKHDISHFHLHDNEGFLDSHLAIGDGNIDFAPVFKKIAESGRCPIIETDTLDSAIRSVNLLKKEMKKI
ncbi:sugar phosphate isomerase/epimerase [Methanomicrobium antiquum]|uniref:Sugar phosphate isomerase/epimerase n=1 Tax=Methanomicrobium antiquum TaxID=487686 RepID=A0AAF0JUC9_9EURY|nr:sugar phosphate isomerase/epimerase family protein [Methanomicrobium antiquum]WFN37633.1 sugar phosphate isomerase/epimerase [Methanomicrobium antiquum]